MLLGALCVITGGEQLMQTWHVDNLDLVDQVNILKSDYFNETAGENLLEAINLMH